jgi:hypothetical protein
VRLLTASTLCIALALYSLLVVQLPFFADDPGVGWHLATGELISSTHEIPRTDPFLASNFSRAWVSDQWLADLLFHSVFRTSGWNGVALSVIVLFLATYLGLLCRTIVTSGASRFSALLAALLAFKIAQIHFIFRPVVFGFPLFTIVSSRCLQVDRDKRGRYELVSLALLFAAWANLHPSFMVGLILVALVPFTSFIRCAGGAEDPSVNKAALYSDLRLFVACAAATLVNPWGIELHRSIFSLGGSGYFMQLHEEWRSPQFRDVEGIVAEVFVMVIAVAHLFFLRTARIAPFEALSLLVFAHLGLQSVRMLPYFAIVASVPFARSVDVIVERIASRLTRLLPGLVHLIERLATRELRAIPASLSIPILCIVMIPLLEMTGHVSILQERGETRLQPSPEKYPYEAVHTLLARETTPDEVVVLSVPEWGGFLTFFGQGRIKPVIDDRNTLVGEEFYRKYLETLSPEGRWERLAVELDAKYFLLPRRARFTEYLRCRNLPVVHQDDLSILLAIPDSLSGQS